MNISTLFQRAHALRMEDKAFTGREASAEFYVGQAIGERIIDTKNANSETILPRTTQIRMVTMPLRDLASRPAALRKTLLERLRWPEDMVKVWNALLQKYGNKPAALHAIADGMEV